MAKEYDQRFGWIPPPPHPPPTVGRLQKTQPTPGAYAYAYADAYAYVCAHHEGPQPCMYANSYVCLHGAILFTSVHNRARESTSSS